MYTIVDVIFISILGRNHYGKKLLQITPPIGGLQKIQRHHEIKDLYRV